MDEKLIERINALAKKSKEEGLTEEEKSEQQKLRREYINVIKKNLRAELRFFAARYWHNSVKMNRHDRVLHRLTKMPTILSSK